MEIYGLVGPSGTGKSTSALSLAYDKQIPAIIDDGLLIINGERVAGRSAKFEKNSITAIKRATFHYQDHADEVKKIIGLHALPKLLVIGTSTNMVDLIASRLDLGSIHHYIHIEDIRHSSEIKLAKFARQTTGSHVMPVPVMQVEQSFFKRLIVRGFKIFSPKKEIIGETTIVRPNFHKDSLIIADEVFKKITKSVCQSSEAVHSCEKVHVTLEGLPSVKVVVKLHHDQDDLNLLDSLKAIQKKINTAYQRYFGLELFSIDVHLVKLV
ncbi:P-loop NTPase family protein [Oceanobacillus halotolerans]|uniref:hypothetical protein n=1 Tax=Oceanobacillus halotolerans TaxID=2663380 RepID=UPI0013DA35CF|nr:hypothetical protein [Oceanobacillus halotolerans]